MGSGGRGGAGRLLLGAGAGCAIGALLALALQLHLAEPPVAPRMPEARAPAAGAQQAAMPPWPTFPGMGRQPPACVRVGGHDVWHAGGTVSVPGDDVLDYYRVQMRARGWEDRTGDYFAPARADSVASPDAMSPEKAEAAARAYEMLAGTKMVLQKGAGSMIINAAPDSATGGTDVRMAGCLTRSIFSVWQDLADELSGQGRGGSLREVILSAAENRGEEYGARLYAGNETPERLCVSVARRMTRDGWGAALPRTEPMGDGSWMAVLTKGDRLGLVVACRGERPDRSLAMFVNVGSAAGPGAADGAGGPGSAGRRKRSS